jgi:ribosomal protein S18 acetylase RimI-like enzyme
MSKFVRRATTNDLPEIIHMLNDDELGKQRESISDASIEKYQRAFIEITEDKNAELLVLELDNKIVGTAQVNYLNYLTYKGGRRAQIESVRIHSGYRGQKLGEFLIATLIERAKERHCHMVQLTTNKIRLRAQHFYEKFGFKATHVGMKLEI